MVKNPPANTGDARDMGSIPGWGRSPGGGSDNPLQCFCLENPMDRGAWQTAVHGVSKSWAPLRIGRGKFLSNPSVSDFSFIFKMF